MDTSDVQPITKTKHTTENGLKREAIKTEVTTRQTQEKKREKKMEKHKEERDGERGALNGVEKQTERGEKKGKVVEEDEDENTVRCFCGCNEVSLYEETHCIGPVLSGLEGSTVPHLCTQQPLK